MSDPLLSDDDELRERLLNEWPEPKGRAVTYRYEPAGYGGEKVPSGGPTVGARAMISHWQRTTGLGSLGIYNPRPVRGGSSWSTHAVGRGGDLQCNANSPDQRAKGEAYARWLIANWEPLGVQYFIWDRRSWRPDRGWRTYSGVSSHRDHLHVELTTHGAAHPSTLWAQLPTPGGFLMALSDQEQKQLLERTNQNNVLLTSINRMLTGEGQSPTNPNGAAKGTMLGRIRDGVARIEAKLK